MSCTCLVSHDDDLAWQLHKASSIKRRSTRRLVEKQFVWEKDNAQFPRNKMKNKMHEPKRDATRRWVQLENKPKLIAYATSDKAHTHTPTHTPTHIGRLSTPTQTRAERAVGTITMTTTTTKTMTIHQYAYCDDIVRVVRIASHQKKGNYEELKANADRIRNVRINDPVTVSQSLPGTGFINQSIACPESLTFRNSFNVYIACYIRPKNKLSKLRRH